jgi:tRNA isopentenyl-2-thiomethyl-A-37 hydroxylase MiaE
VVAGAVVVVAEVVVVVPASSSPQAAATRATTRTSPSQDLMCDLIVTPFLSVSSPEKSGG